MTTETPTQLTNLEPALAEAATKLQAIADREAALVKQADHLRAQLEQVGRDRLYWLGYAGALRALIVRTAEPLTESADARPTEQPASIPETPDPEPGPAPG